MNPADLAHHDLAPEKKLTPLEQELLAVVELIERLAPKRGAFGLYYHFNSVNQLKARASEARAKAEVRQC